MLIMTGQLKPEPKHRAKKTRNAGKSPTSARSGAEPATALTAKLKGSNNPKKVRLTPEERKARAAEKRQELKALGL